MSPAIELETNTCKFLALKGHEYQTIYKLSTFHMKKSHLHLDYMIFEHKDFPYYI